MILGCVDVVLLAADIVTDVVDGMYVAFALMDYNYLKFGEILKNTYFEEHLRTTLSNIYNGTFWENCELVS